MKDSTEILKLLPYEKPFLFIDELIGLDENGAEGYYTFREDEYFYQGHFKGNPVTPGVILTECMAQIGMVCLGIHLVQGLKFKVQRSREAGSPGTEPKFVFTESKVVFEKAVYPGEKVRVLSQKKYWRLGKLKCHVEMFNEKDERVCYGELSGMMRINESKENTSF